MKEAIGRVAATAPHQVGCVSFLNSKPLIDPLLGRDDVQVHFAVPSALLALVDGRTVSTALLSIVDFQLARHDLLLVPAGMIGCDGPTLTVRIFSRVPPTDIQAVYGDTDSHTSVLLGSLILRERFGVSPPMRPYPAPVDPASAPVAPAMPETLLLIGDKVVNAAPSEKDYPYQLDLGEEWKKLTGLPFVFAMWMMRKDAVDLKLARLLAEARRMGAGMTAELVNRHAVERRWPPELARRYFTEYLRYEVTPRARQGLALFFERAGALGLLKPRRPLEFLEID